MIELSFEGAMQEMGDWWTWERREGSLLRD
jgi:hypothetical protein